MVRDIFIYRFLTNFLLISSVVIVDESVPWVSLPKVMNLSLKKNKIFKDMIDNPDFEEV